MQNLHDFSFETFDDFTTDHMLHICNRWAENIQRNPEHLVPRTASWLINNLTYAVIATTANDKQFAGAGGIFPVLDGVQQINFEQLPVYELGSIFVHTEYRKNGIAQRLILERIRLARENGWLPVIVTKAEYIVKIAETFGFVYCLNHPKYNALRDKIRDCTCQNRQGKPFIGERCASCPVNGGKSILVLPPEVIVS